MVPSSMPGAEASTASMSASSVSFSATRRSRGWRDSRSASAFAEMGVTDSISPRRQNSARALHISDHSSDSNHSAVMPAETHSAIRAGVTSTEPMTLRSYSVKSLAIRHLTSGMSSSAMPPAGWLPRAPKIFFCSSRHADFIYLRQFAT